MMKSNLSIILIILTVICVFSVAAIADRCGCSLVPAQEKTDVGGAEEAVEEETSSTEQDVPEEAADEQEQIEKKAPEEEKQAKEEVDEEEPAEEASQQQEQSEAPTIELEIYEGPIYSSSDNVCYYRIKANVTGTPNPEVEFSKDDSGGAWGKLKCQVNLSDPTETYALTATATNSEGSDSDSIDLSWGCNRPPEITEITLMGNHYIGLEYAISAATSDPDGDSLTYNWSVTGGSLDNPSSDSVKWTMPGTAGNYEITVSVEDGNGGQAQKTETVEVLDLLSISISQISGGGRVSSGVFVTVSANAGIGDDIQDRTIRGFLSFDISSLAGKEVVSAEMRFENSQDVNDPYSIIEKIWVESVYWGTGNIEAGDYSLPGILLGEYDIPTFVCSSNKLNEALNQAIDDGHDRFQIRLSHMGDQTNHDGIEDSIWYGGVFVVEFNVTYIP